MKFIIKWIVIIPMLIFFNIGIYFDYLELYIARNVIVYSLVGSFMLSMLGLSILVVFLGRTVHQDIGKEDTDKKDE